MFAAWFHQRNDKNFRPMGHGVVNIEMSIHHFGSIIKFLEDHDNQKLRQELRRLNGQDHKHLKLDINYYR